MDINKNDNLPARTRRSRKRFYEYQNFYGHGMHFLQIINEEKSFKEITEICGERAGNIVF